MTKEQFANKYFNNITSISGAMKFIIFVAKHQYKVNVKFYNKDDDLGGFYDIDESIIYINIYHNKDIEDFLSTFFHELGHHQAVMNKRWTIYHDTFIDDIHLLSRGDFRRYNMTALKAERWVDNWGMNELSQFFPDIQYKKAYIAEPDVQYLREPILKAKQKLKQL